jgi:hypothetical protein
MHLHRATRGVGVPIGHYVGPIAVASGRCGNQNPHTFRLVSPRIPGIGMVVFSDISLPR